MAQLVLAGQIGACGGGGEDGETGASTSDTATSEAGTEESATSTGGDAEAGTTTGDLPELDPLPPLSGVELTTERTLVATHAVASDPISDPRIPVDLASLLDDGYGDVEEAEGEPITDFTLDGAEPPAAVASPELLARFVHLADAQLADDESPARLARFDNTEALGGAFRPQEAHGCRILAAAVRTIAAVHERWPLDLVVLGGDNIDNTQENELWWLRKILDGAGFVHCDSGIDDNPEPGADDDPKDPFASAGLPVPWIWVMGNHDALVQGNLTIRSQGQKAVGTEADGGTRDWSMPGGPVVQGTVAADPGRALLGPNGVLEALLGSAGIEDPAVEAGKATYAYDVGDGVRVIAVDTSAETGAASGLVRGGHVAEVLRPLLETATAEDKLVIVATHHASGALGDGSGLGGSAQPDAIDALAWRALLGEFPNVVLHLAAHSHQHAVRVMAPAVGLPYFEVQTAALADYPHQMRLVEIHRHDDWLAITLIAFDYSTEDDPLAAAGRAAAVTDYTSGWQGGGQGTAADRNVRLWVPTP